MKYVSKFAVDCEVRRAKLSISNKYVLSEYLSEYV